MSILEDDEIDYEPIEPAPQLIAKFEYTKSARNIGADSEGGAKKRPRLAPEERPKETDSRRLAGRQKQIDYGKNTEGYASYIAATPKYILSLFNCLTTLYVS